MAEAISTIAAISSMSSAIEALPIATTTDIPSEPIPTPPVTNYILGFLLIGIAWGFTTPFIRAAARGHRPPMHAYLEDLKTRRETGQGGLRQTIKVKVVEGWFGVTDLLKNWRYALPLVVNLTGSVWFFLLIGQAELSLTVPITNSLAFLFTVLGDWYVEGKVISLDTWAGMGLSLGGIGLCVWSKL